MARHQHSESKGLQRFRNLIGLTTSKKSFWQWRFSVTPGHFCKHDPERNMARFYRVDVAPTLFGEVSVVRSWGRIGTAGRTAFETCPTSEMAEIAAAKTICAKLKRGYLAK